MENLIGVGIADSAEQVRIGEGPFQRVISLLQGGLKRSERRRENFQPSRILSTQCMFTEK